METYFSEIFVKTTLGMSLEDFKKGLEGLKKRGERYDGKVILDLFYKEDRHLGKCLVMKSPGILENIPEESWGTLD